MASDTAHYQGCRMSVLTEIARTIHAIRRAADCDVERLCFEVTPEEWEELMRYFDKANITGQASRPVGDSINVMGITVRKKPPTARPEQP